MSNPDIISHADKALRPVLRKLRDFHWIRVVGCCAGHKPEDTLWLEVNVLGSTGIRRLMDLLAVLDSKLTDTQCVVDCALDFHASTDPTDAPHGWHPCSVEVAWPAKPEWKRSQALIVETLQSTIEDVRSRPNPEPSAGALNYCPFCSSSFIRIETIGTPMRYRCGDCDARWAMTEPQL